MTSQTVLLTASLLLTVTALTAAFVAWHRSMSRHRQQLSERSYRMLKFATPAFMLLAAAPVFDLAVLLAGGAFPTIGFPAIAAGLTGSVATAGYAYVELQTSSTETAPTTDAETAA